MWWCSAAVPEGPAHQISEVTEVASGPGARVAALRPTLQPSDSEHAHARDARFPWPAALGAPPPRRSRARHLQTQAPGTPGWP